MLRRVGIFFIFIFLFPLVAFTVQEKPSLVSLGKQIQFPVEKYILSNGLTVLLHEDHTAPIISYHTWFRVGSRNEEVGYTGIAHLFEHMMFKGAKRYKAGDFERILQANGATNNAFTSQDYTGYYENFPSDKIELIIDVESDRMQNLEINEENLKSEREVVKEERRYRVDNNVMGALRETVYKTAYRVHPYRWPVIGWMKDLNRITLEKCRQFYTTYYAPNNAVVVVAGDFSPTHVKGLIEKYYTQIPSQTLPNIKIPPEPLQKGQRNARIEKNVQSPSIEIAYHTPKAGDDETYAMDLAVAILGEGDSSRLYKRLVYQSQMANSVYAYAGSNKDDGLLHIVASLKPNADLQKVKTALFSEIWKIRKNGVTVAELNKAKNQTVKSYVDHLKTIDGKARFMALNEILLGSYDYFFKDIKKYSEVTPEQVLEVVNKYLGPNQRSVIVVEPKNKISM